MSMMRRLALPLVATLLFAACAAEDDPSSASAAVSAASVKHARVCPGPSAPDDAECHAHVVVDGRGSPLATSGPTGFNPADLRDAYNVTATGSASTTIAIVDAYGYPNAESDLAVYRAQFGLPPCTTANGCFKKVNQNGVQGSYPRADVGWSQEAALDLDMASAMCPNCKILLVQATSSSFSNLGTAVNTAASMGAHVISNSYGGSESSGVASADSFYTHPGVAITVSSGDSGFGVQFPASSPHVTAVGGTHLVLSPTTRGWSETAWSGAGSGCSTVFTKPTWQSDPGCANRTVADVSAVADPATGVSVFGPVNRHASGWMVFGGTSVAAPLVGGVYAANGGSVSFGSDPYAHTGALFDVTSGSNGSCGGSYLCTATAGFDGPTGLGTPDGTTAF
jgi:subtilase family serine protease